MISFFIGVDDLHLDCIINNTKYLFDTTHISAIIYLRT
jgi:hypothetical protein